ERPVGVQLGAPDEDRGGDPASDRARQEPRDAVRDAEIVADERAGAEASPATGDAQVRSEREREAGTAGGTLDRGNDRRVEIEHRLDQRVHPLPERPGAGPAVTLGSVVPGHAERVGAAGEDE